MPHCHPFKHGFYLTGAQPAPSFAEQAVRTPARAGMTAERFYFSR
ncbi:putative secreted protein [Neisseria gonorrhoeae]|nr:putative secreted protein [Neisseria gonorrhoeae]